MISTAIRVARVGSAAELAAAVLMMLGYPCLMLAALVPSIPAFAAAAAVTYLADLYLHRKAPTSSACSAGSGSGCPSGSWSVSCC